MKFGLVTALTVVVLATFITGLFLAIPLEMLCSLVGTPFPTSDFVSWCAGCGLVMFGFMSFAEQWKAAFDHYHV